MSTSNAPPQTADCLDGGGMPGSDATLRLKWIVVAKEGIEAMFRHDPGVFVAGKLRWYPVEGKPGTCIRPDVLIAFGRPRRDRDSYRQWEEDGIAPQVAFEIRSPGDRFGDFMRRFHFYQRHGVEEYYVYDPDRGLLEGWIRAGRRLKAIRKMAGFISPRLGVRFEPGEGPNHLAIVRPDGNPFLSYVPLKQFEAERRRAEAERRRAEGDLARLRELGLEPE